MFEVSKSIHFSYAHRLIHHGGKCVHYHGHNGVAEIFCQSTELDSKSGMVIDFEEISKHVKTWVDNNLDHRMILHKEDPLVPKLKELGEPLYLIDGEPTAERIAQLIYDAAAKAGLPVDRVRLWETPASSAVYKA